MENKPYNILNTNNMIIYYGYTKNIEKIIKSHNAKILKNHNSSTTNSAQMCR